MGFVPVWRAMVFVFFTLTIAKKHSGDPGVLYRVVRQQLENGRARRMKARYIYFVFSSSKAKKKKTGGASIAVGTAPKHPLEKPCDVTD